MYLFTLAHDCNFLLNRSHHETRLVELNVMAAFGRCDIFRIRRETQPLAMYSLPAVFFVRRGAPVMRGDENPQRNAPERLPALPQDALQSCDREVLKLICGRSILSRTLGLIYQRAI